MVRSGFPPNDRVGLLMIVKYPGFRSFGEESLSPLLGVGTAANCSTTAVLVGGKSWLEEPEG